MNGWLLAVAGNASPLPAAGPPGDTSPLPAAGSPGDASPLVGAEGLGVLQYHAACSKQYQRMPITIIAGLMLTLAGGHSALRADWGGSLCSDSNLEATCGEQDESTGHNYGLPLCESPHKYYASSAACMYELYQARWRFPAMTDLGRGDEADGEFGLGSLDEELVRRRTYL